MSLVLLGEGKARYKGEWLDAVTALKQADDHAQQFQSAFGKQRHWLIRPDASSHQRMAQTVAVRVEVGIAPVLIQTTGHHSLRVRQIPASLR